MRGVRTLWIGALFAAGSCIAAAADVVVVVAKDSPVAALTKSQVADIFLGRTRTFPDGRRAEPLDLPEGSAAHDAFYLQYTGRTPAQVKAHWSKLIFTGRGQPPRQLAGVAQVKQALADSPDALAYLPPEALNSTLRTVKVQ